MIFFPILKFFIYYYQYFLIKISKFIFIEYNDSKYYDSVISCLKTNNIYYEESFSEPNHIEHAYRIINCIGGKISIQDIKDNRKCIEMAVGGICPFNGIHTLCHKCRCVEKRPDSSRLDYKYSYLN